MGAQLHAIIIVQKQHKATKRERGAGLPAPDPKRPAPFTPPRNAPISVKACHDNEASKCVDIIPMIS